LVESTASENSLLSLDYPAILALLDERCRTPYGKEAALAFRPTSSREQVVKLQTATREMVQHREMSGNLPLALPTDIRPYLDRLPVEGVRLAGAEVYLVVEQLKAALAVRDALLRSAQMGLREMGRNLPDARNLVRFLDGKISPAGQLEDRCSADLLRIRRQMASLSARLEAELRAIASRSDVSRVLQDDFIALRNNRHVLPIRIDAQGMVDGIVHALSSSGATVYMEPLSTVPLNNELVRLKEQEEVEIQRLLLEFSDLLRSRLGELRSLVSDLGELDLMQARAVLAEEMNGIDPDFHPEESPRSTLLHLSSARHPLLERALRESGRQLVPLDLTLERETPVLVVSGPNTGGKTVALKTVGLLSLMAQSGLKLPAKEAQLPLFRRVLIDIGDHQSISDSLSTFSARMTNISTMTHEFASPGLVLLDEVGSGTDPEEGAALGASIIDYFHRQGAVVLATTHQQGIKAYASRTAGVSNGSMEFDEDSLRPLYRLRSGVPGRSGGLDMAQRLGLPAEIVHQARRLLPRQREILDSYLRSLQTLQEELQKKLAEADEAASRARRRDLEKEHSESLLSQEREARFARALEEAVSLMRREWGDQLREIADRESQRRLMREMQKREQEVIESARAALPRDLLPERPGPSRGNALNLVPGERVRIVSLGLEGTVERVEGERVTLRSGSKIVQARRADLEACEESSHPRPTLPPGVHLTRAQEPELRKELNLTGKRVEEALSLLDKYLDDASLSAVSPLRVIHGMGTGRLRAAIRKFLETHPQVEGFSEAEEREGGGGATVVRLRL